MFDNRETGTFVHYVLENIIRNDINEINLNNIDFYVEKYSNNYLENNNKICDNRTKYVIKRLSESTKNAPWSLQVFSLYRLAVIPVMTGEKIFPFINVMEHL